MLLAGAAAWVAATAARAQGVRTPDGPPARVALFFWGAEGGWITRHRKIAVDRFAHHGFVEGRNLALEVFNTGIQPAQIEAQARDVIARRPAVVLASGTVSVHALARHTRELPIVFMNVSDPVGSKLVESLRRPGRNVTGVSNRFAELMGKRLELLLELVPAARSVMLLHGDGVVDIRQPLRAAAKARGVRLTDLPVRDMAELPATLEAIRKEQPDGILYVGIVPPEVLKDMMASFPIPTVYGDHGYVQAGGLASLGGRTADQLVRAVDLCVRILQGASPATLPVDQLVAPHLALNRGTARRIGLVIPQAVLLRADEVLE